MATSNYKKAKNKSNDKQVSDEFINTKNDEFNIYFSQNYEF